MVDVAKMQYNVFYLLKREICRILFGSNSVTPCALINDFARIYIEETQYKNVGANVWQIVAYLLDIDTNLLFSYHIGFSFGWRYSEKGRNDANFQRQRKKKGASGWIIVNRDKRGKRNPLFALFSLEIFQEENGMQEKKN